LENGKRFINAAVDGKDEGNENEAVFGMKRLKHITA